MSPSLRPLTRTDIPVWADLLAAIEAEDRTGEHYNAADLDEEMDNPDIEVGKDIVGAWDGDDLVGYFSVYPRSSADGYCKINVEGAVRPDRRGEGIGTVLVTAMIERSAAARDEREPLLPARVSLTGLTSNSAQASLAADVGLLPERWNFVMRTVLDDLPAAPELAAGYEFRQYHPSMAATLRATHNVAFLDHPNFTPWSDTMWTQWVTESRSFRPDLSFVVVPVGSDDIVSYVQTNEYDAYFEVTGRREAYVAKVGTLREHRGKGLAGALLGYCLRAYRDAGFDESSLDVDSENPTGALGVYERAGYAVESRWTNYAMVLPPRP